MNKTTVLRVALGLALGLVLVEGAAWAVDGGGFPVFNRFVPDTELGVRLEPGAETRLTFRGTTTEISINAEGYRGEDWGPSQEGEVLIVGDSQIFGLGVNDGESHSAVLAASTGRKVLNGGVITYGPAEYRAVVAEQLAAREGITEVVVVYNFANDPFELGNPNTGRHAVVDGWALRKELAPEEVTQFPGRTWLMGRSHAVYHTRKLLHAGDTESPNLPSEGDFEQLLAAQLAGEEQVQEQAQEQAQIQAPTMSLQEQIDGSGPYASAHRYLSESESDLAYLLWQIEHPNETPLQAMEEKLSADTRYLDVLYPRNVEAARPVPEIAALLLTSTRRLQGAETKLAEWAQAHPNSPKTREINTLLEARAQTRAKIAELGQLPATQDPASPFWTELVALRTLCADHGATLTVVGLPLDVQVDPAEWDKYDAPRQDLSETLVLIDALMEDAERLGLRHLNLSESLLAAQPGAFLDGDLHMSAKGHAAVAAALDALLDQQPPLAMPLPGQAAGRSRVPTWGEVRRLEENSVKGSSRNHCITHHVREWLSVRCFAPPPPEAAVLGAARLRTREASTSSFRSDPDSWKPRGLSLLNAPLETLSLVVPEHQISVIMPLTPGRDAEVDFHWSNRTERLELRWDGQTPQLAFVDRRPSSPGTAPHAQDRWDDTRDFDQGRAPVCDAAAATGACRPGEASSCAEGQISTGPAQVCLSLCDAAHPCETGTCLPWQGAQLCQ